MSTGYDGFLNKHTRMQWSGVHIVYLNTSNAYENKNHAYIHLGFIH